VFIVLAVTGYGGLDFKSKSGEVLDINGHRVTNFPVKLRPGSYKVTVKTPRYIARDMVTVGLFKTIQYKPSLKERSADDIVGSQIGAFRGFGPPTTDRVKWYNNDTWMTAIVGPQEVAPIALHYSQNAWHIAYFYNNDGSYPTDISVLPPDVATYMQQALQEVSQG
jgi:hypothetical protein